MRKELVISTSDLRFVCIRCQHCGTKVILDMVVTPERARTLNSFTPKKCPGCNVYYDSAIAPAVDELQKVYEGLLKAEAWVTFHALAPDENELRLGD